MKSIPIIRMRCPWLFAEALRLQGAPSTRYLDQAHIASDAMEDQDRRISVYSFLKFIELAATDTEIPDLGLLAAVVAQQDPGRLEIGVAQSPTLYRAINQFCLGARAHHSRADVYLTRQADTAWLCRGPLPALPIVAAHIEQFVLGSMLHILRLYLGSEWQPRLLKLQCVDGRGFDNTDVLRHTNVQFGSPHLAVGFPISALANRPIAPPRNAHHPHLNPLVEPDPLITLRGLLTDYVAHTSPSIGMAADICGLSSRTLGRQLGEKGTTFRRLVDEIRFGRAIQLLRDDAVTITDVAYGIGYSDVAHFSRAFRRMSGMAPREFRKQMNIGESIAGNERGRQRAAANALHAA